MLKVGLTSGIGCGKTTVTQHLRSLGVAIIDADQIARDVVQPGQPALALIIQQFGVDACQSDGQLDRAWLREKVFANVTLREQLEGILHPLIRSAIEEKMQQVFDAPYLVADIPLLIEKHYQNLFARIIVVDCTPEQQITRIQKRDGSDVTLIQAIMDAQVSRDERLSMATDILDNTTSVEALKRQVEMLHKRLLLLAGHV